jgi:hypothetical protein
MGSTRNSVQVAGTTRPFFVPPEQFLLEIRERRSVDRIGGSAQ